MKNQESGRCAREWKTENPTGRGEFEDLLNQAEEEGWELHSWQVNETDDGGPWIIAVWHRPKTTEETP